MILELIIAAISVTPAYTNVNRAGGSKIMTNIEQWAPAVEAAIATKQTNLVSGVNIKTINGDSILGNGNLVIEGGGGTVTPSQVTNIASSASVTNAGAVAAAKADAAGMTNNITFAQLKTKPNTLGGYGITNAYTKAETDAGFVPWVTDVHTNKTSVTIGSRPTLSDVEEWREEVEYEQNDLVKHDEKVYICISDRDSAVEGGTWESQADYWQEVKVSRGSLVQGFLCVAGCGDDDPDVPGVYPNDYCSHAEGYNTHAEGRCTHAEGYLTHAEGDSTHAEGYLTLASGNYSHAEGYGSVCDTDSVCSHAEGRNTFVIGIYSHAEGGMTRVLEGASFSHAEGAYTVADGDAAHAAGWGANATNQTAFAWQGIPQDKNAWEEPTAAEKYYDHGAGTYNINPVGGLTGFWVGETNMATHTSTIATNAAEAVVAEVLDYALTNLTGATVSLRSGEIGNLTLSNAQTNLALSLDFSASPDRSGDCMLLAFCGAETTLAVGPSQAVDILGSYDKLKKGTNLVAVTRMMMRGTNSVVMVNVKEVK